MRQRIIFNPAYQPIAFVSHKFSAPASRWTTIEQEAYGIYYDIKQGSLKKSPAVSPWQ